MMSVQKSNARDPEIEFSLVTSNFAQIALESVAAALIVMDLSGCIRYLNLAASQMLRRTLEEVRGWHWRDCLNVIDENTRKPVTDPVSLCLDSRKTTQLGLHALLITTHGAEIPVEGTVAPFCWLDDDVFGSVMMLRDITTTRNLIRQTFSPVD